MRPTCHRRSGYTLFELIMIIAVLIILGSLVIPTLTGTYSNTRQKSAADLIRARIVEGRAKAMEQGMWYRFAINQDKTRIRLAPDAGINGTDFGSLTPGESDTPDAQVIEDKLDHATAELQIDPNDTTRSSPDGEWATVMTIGPEGICKESDTSILVKEEKFHPIEIRIRGIAASAAVVGMPPPSNGSKQ